jgi:2-polyprenyl-3-methyl-5-hydroxy-6-metoxy-1,4-benzoquinol methylase
LNCGGAEYLPVLEDIPDRLLRLSGRFNYGSCVRCHLLQIREVPPDLARWYSGYERHSKESPVYAFFRRAVTGRCYAFPTGAGRQLLDVGCGNGWYLQAMSNRGWQATGYELDRTYAEDLTERIGLPVISGLEQLNQNAARFDLATFNFSFEHLAHPRQTLQAVSGALRPGGRIIMLVPNAQGREAGIFGRRWFHLEAPRHITFYGKQQLAELVAEMGFEQVRVDNVPVATGFAGSLSYLIFGYLHPLAWYPAILPGMLFSLLVRDGIFRVSAVKA